MRGNALETPVVIAYSAPDFLVTLAEPTRLRILNCVAAAPLFVSDLVRILGLPQPTVSRHLRVLRDLGLVDAITLPPYVLHRLQLTGAHARLVRVVLDALRDAPEYRAERLLAHEASRADVSTRGPHAPVVDLHAP
jgi:ArsR family transcriptional regulator